MRQSASPCWSIISLSNLFRLWSSDVWINLKASDLVLLYRLALENAL